MHNEARIRYINLRRMKKDAKLIAYKLKKKKKIFSFASKLTQEGPLQSTNNQSHLDLNRL